MGPGCGDGRAASTKLRSDFLGNSKRQDLFAGGSNSSSTLDSAVSCSKICKTSLCLCFLMGKVEDKPVSCSYLRLCKVAQRAWETQLLSLAFPWAGLQTPGLTSQVHRLSKPPSPLPSPVTVYLVEDNWKNSVQQVWATASPVSASQYFVLSCAPTTPIFLPRIENELPLLVRHSNREAKKTPGCRRGLLP